MTRRLTLTRRSALAVILAVLCGVSIVAAFAAKPTVSSGRSVRKALLKTAVQPAATAAQKIADAPNSVQPVGAAAAGYSMPWYMFNAGGITRGISSLHALGASAGGTVAGSGSSADFSLQTGFWAGAAGCACPSQGDLDGDAFVTAVDLNLIIDVLWAGGTNVHDPRCPTSRSDYDCDGFPDATDLALFIDYVFSGGAPSCSPCAQM